MALDFQELRTSLRDELRQELNERRGLDDIQLID